MIDESSHNLDRFPEGKLHLFSKEEDFIVYFDLKNGETVIIFYFLFSKLTVVINKYFSWTKVYEKNLITRASGIF